VYSNIKEAYTVVTSTKLHVALRMECCFFQRWFVENDDVFL